MKQEAERGQTCAPDSWYGKTCREPLAQTKGKISAQSCKKPPELLPRKPPLFLRLGTDGLWQDASQDRGGVWSIAWRVFDAQFWGVPQRRRRIALVADFSGQRAPEVLFERESMPWDYPACGTAAEGASCDASGSTVRSNQDVDHRGLTSAALDGDCTPINMMLATRHEALGRATGFGIGEQGEPQFTLSATHHHAVCYPEIARSLTARHDGSPCVDRGPNIVALTNRGAISGDVTETLRAESHGAIPMVYAAGFKAGQSEKARSIGYADEQAPTLSANACGLEPTVFCIQGDGVDRPAIAYDARGNGGECVAPTLTGDHESRVTDYTVLTVDGFFVRQSNSEYADSRVASTQLARQHKDVTDVVVAKSIEDVSAFDCRNLTERLELSATLQAKDGGGYSLNYQNPVFYRALGGTRKLLRYVVRRLIPLECERLQGFPDGWTDIGSWTDTKGKQHKESTDSQRYKALGNSIAIPPWSYVLQKLALCCRAGATMASLFDGIGGFPLIWEWLNGKGSCLWGSEIDEFAIAVTKRHFPEAKERICGA